MLPPKKIAHIKIKFLTVRDSVDDFSPFSKGIDIQFVYSYMRFITITIIIMLNKYKTICKALKVTRRYSFV